jgi:Glyoxalase/Bleomycin resistance protein/Dioxygenase superfamily
MSVIEKYLKSGPSHLAYVTNDLTQAKNILQQLFGISHFVKAGGVETSHQQYRGKPAVVKMDVAIAWTGTIFIEIIQPLTPDSPYSSLIKPSGFSLAFHHFCLDVDDWDQFLKEFKEDDGTLIYSAEAEGYYRMGYWDLTDTLGHSIEFLYCTPEGKAFFEAIKNGLL